ncbi:hypothetical protein [Burkholderia plantarii]|uniref:hypothetical protein n=1 Tax=Burkholderia plantarii TaxID=41899 RepID=UPI0008709655|nr:hypothetical protein [Burkholderia plantarii]
MFVAQTAATGQMGEVAGKAKSSMAGVCVCCYYAGGSVGAFASGIAYTAGGWPACMALVRAVTLVSAVIRVRYFTIAGTGYGLNRQYRRRSLAGFDEVAFKSKSHLAGRTIRSSA